jgi:hypothetical protein
LWEGKRGKRYQRGRDSNFISVRPGSLNDWRERSQSFESMSGYCCATAMLPGGERDAIALLRDSVRVQFSPETMYVTLSGAAKNAMT